MKKCLMKTPLMELSLKKQSMAQLLVAAAAAAAVSLMTAAAVAVLLELLPLSLPLSLPHSHVMTELTDVIRGSGVFATREKDRHGPVAVKIRTGVPRAAQLHMLATPAKK